MDRYRPRQIPQKLHLWMTPYYVPLLALSELFAIVAGPTIKGDGSDAVVTGLCSSLFLRVFDVAGIQLECPLRPIFFFLVSIYFAQLLFGLITFISPSLDRLNLTKFMPLACGL